MSRPFLYPTWSTNTSYPAGSKDWSGQTTKVQPSAGKQSQGLEPNTDQAAEEINWLYNLQGQWINHFDQTEESRESFLWADDGTSYTADQLPVPNYGPASLKVSDVSGSITVVGGGTGSTPMMSRSLKFAPPSAGNFCFYSTTPKLLGFSAGSGATIANFYWHMRVATMFAAVPSATNNYYFAGLNKVRAWAPSGNTNTGRFGIEYWRNVSTHWRFVMDGTTVTLAAGQDPTNATWQYWDIEFFGQSTPQGVLQGSQFGRLSLNGAEVARINASPNSADGNRYIVAGANTDTGSAGANFSVSGYVSRWTMGV